jgi:hypothetical protein
MGLTTSFNASPARKQRSTLTLGLLLAFPAATLLLLWSSAGADPRTAALLVEDLDLGTSLIDESSVGGGGLFNLSGLRVGLQDGVDFHEEVFGAALYSFAAAGAELSTYHPPYRAGFSLVTGPLFAGRPAPPLQPPSNFVHDLKRGALDLAVVTSADASWLDKAVLKALVRAKKTQAVLFFHQMSDFGQPEQMDDLRPLARDRRLTVVGLGEVVYVASTRLRRAPVAARLTRTPSRPFCRTKQLRRHLAEWASVDPDGGWTEVAVELFVPVRVRPGHDP